MRRVITRRKSEIHTTSWTSEDRVCLERVASSFWGLVTRGVAGTHVGESRWILRGRQISWEANGWLLSIQIEFSLGTTREQDGKEGRCVSLLRESQSKASVGGVSSMSEVHLKIF